MTQATWVAVTIGVPWLIPRPYHLPRAHIQLMQEYGAMAIFKQMSIQDTYEYLFCHKTIMEIHCFPDHSI